MGDKKNNNEKGCDYCFQLIPLANVCKD